MSVPLITGSNVVTNKDGGLDDVTSVPNKDGGGKNCGEESMVMLTLQWLGMGTLFIRRNPTGSCSTFVPKQ